MKTAPGKWKYWLVGSRKTKQIGIRIDDWTDMDLVGAQSFRAKEGILRSWD